VSARLIGAELFKQRTTRTFYGLTGGAIALVLIISVLGSALGDFKHEQHPLENLVNIGGLSQVFAVVLGILALTTEYRHGTITPTLLAVPDRARLVAGKLAAVLLIGLVLGLVCIGVVAIVALLIFSGRGIDSGATGGDVARFLAGGAVSAALNGAFGVGLGAIVRNQVGAVVGVLVWGFVLEPLIGLIPGLKDVVPKWGLGGISNEVAGTSTTAHAFGQVPAGLVLAGYCAIFVAAGIVMMRRRDVSA
jgi:ABC-2 type transport system permease protein